MQLVLEGMINHGFFDSGKTTSKLLNIFLLKVTLKRKLW